MTAPSEILQKKIAAFLSWEKRKRREFILTALACYALAGALVLAPLVAQMPSGVVWLPVAVAMILAPFLFIKQRWIDQDTVRSLAHLDKTLRTDERTLTAWDLLRRQDASAGALLVIQQADKLMSFEPQKTFPRRWQWQAYGIVPLVCVWLTLCWFQLTMPAPQPRRAPTLAQKVKEYARELQEKAQGEGLKESLQAGKEIEKLAQQELDKSRGDEQLKKDLAGVSQKLAAAAKQAAQHASLSSAESEQSLQDLKAELEAARDLFAAPSDPQGSRSPQPSWLDRLATLPQLNRQLAKEDGGGQSMSERDAKSFLNKLDKQVSAELDRRTLLDAQEFLRQMMQQGAGESGKTNARAGGREQSANADDGEKGPSQSNLPGSEAGKRTDAAPSLPQFPAGPSTHVKALLGEGSSNAIEFKGKPAPGKSTLSQQEMVATYRRQAEQDLNSERVPEALKETIRNYFMALGEGKQ